MYMKTSLRGVDIVWSIRGIQIDNFEESECNSGSSFFAKFIFIKYPPLAKTMLNMTGLPCIF